MSKEEKQENAKLFEEAKASGNMLEESEKSFDYKFFELSNKETLAYQTKGEGALKVILVHGTVTTGLIW